MSEGDSEDDINVFELAEDTDSEPGAGGRNKSPPTTSGSESDGEWVMHEAAPQQQQQQHKQQEEVGPGKKARQKKKRPGEAVEPEGAAPGAAERSQTKKKARSRKVAGDGEGEGDGVFAPAEEYEHLTVEGAAPPQGVQLPKRRQYKKAGKKPRKGSMSAAV